MAKPRPSRKSPGRHVGGHGRGRKMESGPGPDRPTAAEVEEFRKKLRAYDEKGEAERALDRLVERYEAWRARETERFRVALERERQEIASEQEWLRKREQQQIRIEQKSDEEGASARLSSKRDAKILPTEELVAARAELDRDRAELAAAQESHARAKEAIRREEENHRRRQAAFDATASRALTDLRSVEESS